MTYVDHVAQVQTTGRISTGPASVESLVRALRPRQWVKNLLIGAAPLAAGSILDVEVLIRLGAAFALFCMASSAVYLVNDVVDAPADRLHPRKRLRPVASGRLAPSFAIGTAVVLAATAVAGGFAVEPKFGLIVCVYLSLQAGYVFWLKSEPVVELALVASGFVLRAVAGGVAIGIPLSQWFLLVAGFGSLFLAAGKRYSELQFLGADSPTRACLGHYSESYLRFVWSSSAVVTLTMYCLWAFEITNGGLSWEAASIAPFALGVLKYAVRIDGAGAGEPESIFWSDRAMQLVGVVWLVLFALGALDA